MSERTRRYLPLLKQINRLGERAKRQLIKKCDREFLDCVSECAKNFIKGNVPLKPAQLRRLRSDRSIQGCYQCSVWLSADRPKTRTRRAISFENKRISWRKSIRPRQSRQIKQRVRNTSRHFCIRHASERIGSILRSRFRILDNA